MRQNESLAGFMKKKRRELGKKQEQIAEAVGVARSTYCVWERNGHLPRENPERVAKIASALGTTVERLTGFEDNPPSEAFRASAGMNLLPLLRVIVQSNCQAVTLDDLRFLLETQHGLNTTMSPELVDALMEHRSQ